MHYYLTQFGGSLYYHYTQYGCWSGTHHVSDGGNCCIGSSILDPQFSIGASFSVPDDTLCAKVPVTFANTSFNTFPGATIYRWNFGDATPLSFLENPTHIYGDEGSYTAILIASNEAGTASDTTEMLLTLINCFTGSNSIKATKEVQISPNPAADKFCFQFPGKSRNGDGLKLFGQFGNLIVSDDLPVGIEYWCIEKTAQMPPGVYLAVVSLNGEVFSKKLMLE